MSNIVSSFFDALKVYRQDKWVTILSIIPIILGVLFFTFLGSFMYTDLLNWGDSLLKGYVGSETLNGFLYYVLVALSTIALYLMIAYLFVFVVSIFSCAFNDIISERVEKVTLGIDQVSIAESFRSTFAKIGFIIINECKKIGFILFFTLLAFALGFIPILSLISAFLSALLLSVSFLDYCWSRKHFTFKACFNDVRKNLIKYGLPGFIFLILLSVPVVNLLAYAFGINYFSVLFTKLHQDEKDTNQPQRV